MRIGVLGRTSWLLASAIHLSKTENEISFVATAREAPHSEVNPKSFEQLAADNECPFVTGVNSVISAIVEGHLKADVVISMNWPSILPETVISSFRLGILNAHAGDLPRYRGNACPNWAILNNETEIALTIHKMVQELDAGPIAAQAKMRLETDTYISDVYEWLQKTTPQLFEVAVRNLENNVIFPQDSRSTPLRTFPRNPNDGLIDWNFDTERVHRLVRASSRPFDGAFTFLGDGHRISIWRAKRFTPPFHFSAVPGQVCLRAGLNPVIATSDGMLELTETSSELGGHPETSELICSSFRNRFVLPWQQRFL